MKRFLLILGVLAVILAVAGYLFLTTQSGPEQAGLDGKESPLVIEMTTSQWRFDVVSVTPTGSASFSSTPPTGRFANTTITVHKGDTVVLHVRNLDVPHGFALEEFGVNTTTPPGQVTEVKFVANLEGRFTFFCTVFCGTGHPNHKGTLIVEG